MDYKGKKAAFYTLGCKLNFSETSTIASSFKEVGFDRVEFDEKADVYVINTCSVTNQGDKASRNIVRKAVKQNPDAMVIVVGCYSQLKPDEVGHIDGVDMVLGTQEKISYSALPWRPAQTRNHRDKNNTFSRYKKLPQSIFMGRPHP